ncbi:MAG TPA: glycosyltransferase [Gaiellaceae bacterium]|nr:glycosyltransferase [Gaiellaceae bacterium]
MTGHPRGIDVAMVSWRCLPLLRRCLESLRAAPPALPMRVVVVDNASEDGTAEAVRAEHPEVEIVESPRNLGFAAATNVAIRRTGAEFVLALNPDTEIPPGRSTASWRSSTSIRRSGSSAPASSYGTARSTTPRGARSRRRSAR